MIFATHVFMLDTDLRICYILSVFAYSIIHNTCILCRQVDGSLLNRIGKHTVDEAAFRCGVNQ